MKDEWPYLYLDCRRIAYHWEMMKNKPIDLELLECPFIALSVFPGGDVLPQAGSFPPTTQRNCSHALSTADEFIIFHYLLVLKLKNQLVRIWRAKSTHLLFQPFLFVESLASWVEVQSSLVTFRSAGFIWFEDICWCSQCWAQAVIHSKIVLQPEIMQQLIANISQLMPTVL